MFKDEVEVLKLQDQKRIHNMLIGTLSFERVGETLKLPHEERRELIAHVVEKHEPDLLVCAGHSLGNDDDLTQLSNDNRVFSGKSFLIVEIQKSHDLAKAKNAGQLPKAASEHQVYLISPRGYVKSLGRQVIKESQELRGSERQALTKSFEELVCEKSAVVNGHKLFTLCCGEINILKGRDTVEAQFPAAESALLGATIIINPTHDLMGNAGTLIAKRSWLSKPINGQKRVYVSASNWNSKTRTGRRQRPDSRTLHTVFISGFEKKMSHFPDPEGRYMYRECEADL